MLLSFKYHRSILESGKELIGNSILYKFLELKKKNIQGLKINFSHCDKCNDDFYYDKKERITLFQCGHKYHTICLGDEKHICDTCFKNYVDESNVINYDFILRDVYISIM